MTTQSLELNVGRRAKKFVMFRMATQGENEFDISSARAWIDVYSIESFYETTDNHVILLTETGDGFKVEESAEYILSHLND